MISGSIVFDSDDEPSLLIHRDGVPLCIVDKQQVEFWVHLFTSVPYDQLVNRKRKRAAGKKKKMNS